MVKDGDIARVIDPFGERNKDTAGQLVKVINVHTDMGEQYARFIPLTSNWRGPHADKIKTWRACRLEAL